MFSLPSFGFKKVFQKGKIKKSDSMVLKFVENQKEFSRFGLVISAKSIKKAVLRNKVRRQAKEIIGKLLEEEKIAKGLDFVLIFKKEIDFQALRKELEGLLCLKKSF